MIRDRDSSLPGYQRPINGYRNPCKQMKRYYRNPIDPSQLVALRRKYRHNVIDPSQLVALRKNYRRNYIDPSQLVMLRNPWDDHGKSLNLVKEAERALQRHNLDEAKDKYLKASISEEIAFDSVGFDKPRTRGLLAVNAVNYAIKGQDSNRAKALANKYLAMNLPDFAKAKLMSLLKVSSRRNPWRRNPWRRNPDPNGEPWGPQLYNPLRDQNHDFRDESHYHQMIAKLKRNPYHWGRNF